MDSVFQRRCSGTGLGCSGDSLPEEAGQQQDAARPQDAGPIETMKMSILLHIQDEGAFISTAYGVFPGSSHGFAVCVLRAHARRRRSYDMRHSVA